MKHLGTIGNAVLVSKHEIPGIFIWRCLFYESFQSTREMCDSLTCLIESKARTFLCILWIIYL